MVALWTAHAQLSRFYLNSIPRDQALHENTKVRGPGVEATKIPLDHLTWPTFALTNLDPGCRTLYSTSIGCCMYQ